MARKATKENIKDTELVNEIDVDAIKEELQDYVTIQVKKQFDSEMEKTTKKHIREKNRKIFFKNITILFLLMIIMFLLYLLYDSGYFDKFFHLECNNNSNNTIIMDNYNSNGTTENKTIEVKEPTLDELKKQYSYLLDSFILNENSQYLDDFYNGKLTNDLKIYFALSQLDFKKISVIEDYNVINEEELKNEYTKLFSDDYTANSFDYNGNKIRYFEQMQSYVTTSLLEKSNSNIHREIIDIKVKDGIVNIKTVEGIIKDNKLYTVKMDEVANYKKDSLVNYKDKLNTITYVFGDNNLLKIVK